MNFNLSTIFIPSLQMGGVRNGGARQHRGSGGNGGMVVSTAPAAPNNVYYHYVPVPNPPLYYTQPQQYPTSPVSGLVEYRLLHTEFYIIILLC
jgi:hypothetical protein